MDTLYNIPVNPLIFFHQRQPYYVAKMKPAVWKRVN